MLHDILPRRTIPLKHIRPVCSFTIETLILTSFPGTMTKRVHVIAARKNVGIGIPLLENVML